MTLNNRQTGFTLLQTAIALIVIGFIVIAVLRLQENLKISERQEITQSNIQDVISALNQHRLGRGFYPCPAPINANRGLTALLPAPMYGRGSNYARYLTTGAVPLTPGQCGEGICVESNVRGDLAGAPTLRVRVGAVPFRDMQLDEKISFDGYGSRLWYAVTEEMCQEATFNENRGAISVVNNAGISQVSPNNSAAFIIISPGSNKIGAYSNAGAFQGACTNAGNGENQNCRDVSVAAQANNTATYVSTFAQNTYDDIADYFMTQTTPVWRRTNPTSQDIVDLANNTIGINSPGTGTLNLSQSIVDMNTTNMYGAAPDTAYSPEYQHGSLRLTTGNSLRANTYCGAGGTNCFQTRDIRGTPPTGGMRCPPGQVAVGIMQGTATNATLRCSNSVTTECPTGQALTGFGKTGGVLTPQCSATPLQAGCTPQTVTPCPSFPAVNLPASPSGTTIKPGTRGSCREVIYTCNAGTWEDISTGSCTNNVVTTRLEDCYRDTDGNRHWPYDESCWQDGTYTVTERECSGTTDNYATQCRCQNCRVERHCGADNVTGSIITDYTCTLPATLEPSTETSTCTCGLTPQNVFRDCSPGYTRSASAPSNINWPSDQAGLYALANPLPDCSGFEEPSDASFGQNNYCVCDTATQYDPSGPVTPPACKTEKSGGRNDPNGNYVPWNYNITESTVNAATCGKNASSVWSDPDGPAQFDEKILRWRETGSPYADAPDHDPDYKINDICGCSPTKPEGRIPSNGCTKTVGTKVKKVPCSCSL